MADHKWIVDVCRDLHKYAVNNDLQNTAEAIMVTINTVTREIDASKPCSPQEIDLIGEYVHISDDNTAALNCGKVLHFPELAN